jgi:serine/threonine protein kinase
MFIQMSDKEIIKLIGQGSYGCVYRPSVDCQDQDPLELPSHKLVSKIMTRENAEHENKQYHKLARSGALLSGIGAPKPPKICYRPNITVDMLQKTGCQIKDFKRDKRGVNLASLNYEYVGETLRNAKPPKEKEFLEALLPVVKGLRAINRQHIYHSDLKSDNITVDEEGKLHIIDWGLAGTATESIDSINASQYYTFWPWDRLLISSGRGELNKPFQRERIIYQRLEEYLQNKYPNDERSQMREQFEITHILDHYGYKAVVEQTLATLDSYCLGSMLKFVHYHRTKYRWPEWSEDMEQMINGMISFNPMTRWTWSRIIKQIERIIGIHVEFSNLTKTPKPSSHLFSKTIHPNKFKKSSAKIDERSYSL